MKTAERALQESIAINPAHKDAVEAGIVIRERVSQLGFGILDSMMKRVDNMTIAQRFSMTRMVDAGFPVAASDHVGTVGEYNPRLIGVSEEQAKREAIKLRIRAGITLVTQLASYIESLELEIRSAGTD